jgi:hypothetical protein
LLSIGSEGAIIDADPLFVKQSIPQNYRKLLLEKQFGVLSATLYCKVVVAYFAL